MNVPFLQLPDWLMWLVVERIPPADPTGHYRYRKRRILWGLYVKPSIWLVVGWLVITNPEWRRRYRAHGGRWPWVVA